MAEKTREQKIRAEKKRLSAVFSDLDENKRAVAGTLIDRAAYITVSLQELEAQLTATGWVEEYQNGETQRGMKKSAAADVHISLTKNLTAIMKTLIELVPASQKKSRLEELMTQ